ncbi:4-coumarate--CoA ligase 1-like [Ixodes scapularis]
MVSLQSHVRVATPNVRGLSDRRRQRQLCRLAVEQDLDIIAVQETKVESEDQTKFMKLTHPHLTCEDEEHKGGRKKGKQGNLIKRVKKKMTLKARIENGIVYSPYPSEPVPEMTFYQVVKHSLEQYGCRTALVWNDEDITFAELLKMCQRYAAGFQKHGVKKGEKVLVHLDNSLENMIALYSAVFAGGVFVASHLILSDDSFAKEEHIARMESRRREQNQRCKRRRRTTEAKRKREARRRQHFTPAEPPDDILYRIRDSNAAHILTTASEAKRFSNLRNKMDVKGYFCVGTAPGFVSVSDFKGLNEDTFQEFPVADVKKEVIVLLYTSGTTGSPKAVEHTHYSIVAHLPRPGSHRVSSDQEVVASCLPISSTSTFRFYLEDTTSGAKTVLLSKAMDTDKMVDAMRKYKVI